MSTYKFARRALLAAVVIAVSAGPVTAHARDASPAPGSFAAIMAIKDPSHFGPHLPAADLPPRTDAWAPAPGSFAAIMSIKDPSHYGPHLPAADLPPRATCTLRSGSWEAIMSVKDPQHYGPCGRRSTDKH
ncbi:MAG: hypothetical protein NVS9B10_13980 [Nevskia sp.]